MIINDEKKLIFYHAPRTGGTAVVNELLKYPEWNRASKLHPKLQEITNNGHYKQSHIFNDKELYNKYKDYQSFCIARDPYDRVLSCYLFLLKLTSKYISNKRLCTPADYDWASNFHNKLISYGFLKCVNNGEFWYEHYSNECCEWMVDGIWFMHENMYELEQYLNIKLEQNINSTSHTHYSHYYDDETKNTVSELYKNDIEKFKYQFCIGWRHTPEYRKALVCDPDYFDLGRNNIGGKYVVNLIKPNHKVLDLGCGVLRIGLPLIKYLESNNYYGFDISEYRISEAKKEVNCNNLSIKYPTLTSNWSEINIKFDFIWCYQVFIHLSDERLNDLLNKIANSLKDDGVCIASINISDKYGDSMTWNEFPFVCRPYSFYEERLRYHGLKFEKVANWGVDSPEDGGERLIKIRKIDLQKVN